MFFCCLFFCHHYLKEKVIGYTHFFEKAININDENWNGFCEICKKILQIADIPLAREFNLPLEPPVITDKLVRFNGIDEDGHETFYIERSYTGFGFCKTARKPYDKVVVACLLAGCDYDVFTEWSSDGDDEDHQEGKEIYAKALNEYRKDWIQ